MTEIKKELELNYNLQVKDLVELRMYNTSLNEKLNKSRNLNRFGMLLICIVIAGVYVYKGDHVASTSFLVIGTISFIVYPWYLNWLYRRTYRKQISSTDFPIHVWLKMDEDSIITLAKGVTSKIEMLEIEEIVETDACFFMRKTAKEWVTIPKSELKNEDEVRAFLTSVALIHDITYSEKKGFKWK